eukprot:3482687-Alexandrium_andersonii.AAC.1
MFPREVAVPTLPVVHSALSSARKSANIGAPLVRVAEAAAPRASAKSCRSAVALLLLPLWPQLSSWPCADPRPTRKQPSSAHGQ